VQNRILAAWLVASAVALGTTACRQAEPARPAGPPAASATTKAADARLEGSSRFERDGWIFVHLEGPPATLGFQHGYLLAKEIEDLLRVMKPFLQQTTRRDWTFYRDAASSTASSPA
jgi:hypothetical protein